MFPKGGSGPFAHSLDLYWIRLHLPPYENVAEKSDRGRVVFEFLRLDIDFPRGVAGHSRHEPGAPLEIWKKI